MSRYFIEMEHEVLAADHTHDDDDDDFVNTLRKRIGKNRRYEHDTIEFIEAIHYMLEAPNGKEGPHVHNGACRAPAPPSPRAAALSPLAPASSSYHPQRVTLSSSSPPSARHPYQPATLSPPPSSLGLPLTRHPHPTTCIPSILY